MKRTFIYLLLALFVYVGYKYFTMKNQLKQKSHSNSNPKNIKKSPNWNAVDVEYEEIKEEKNEK